jgi:hypothetical protein
LVLHGRPQSRLRADRALLFALVAGTTADEGGYIFSAERFEPGEYVSVHEAEGTRAYRVAAVLPL